MLVTTKPRFLPVVFLFLLFVHYSSSSNHSTSSDSLSGSIGGEQAKVKVGSPPSKVGSPIVKVGSPPVKTGSSAAKIWPLPAKDDCTESEYEVGPNYHQIEQASDEDEDASKSNNLLGFGTDYDVVLQPKRRRRKQKCKQTVKSKCKKSQRKGNQQSNTGAMKQKKQGGGDQRKERNSKRLKRKGFRRKKRRAGKKGHRFGNRSVTMIYNAKDWKQV